MNFQINEIKFNSKKIALTKVNTINSNHTFTVITGKNAAGKSRLLNTIIKSFFSQNEISKDSPNKIIAISNMYNDRFPLKPPINSVQKYEYFGYKSKNQTNNDDKFFYFKNLITKKDINLKSIMTTFEYLGFKPKIFVSFSLFINKRVQYSKEFPKHIISTFKKNEKNFKAYSKDTKNIIDFYNTINPSIDSMKSSKSIIFEISNIFNNKVESQKEALLNFRFKFLSLNKFEQEFMFILIDLVKKDLILNKAEFIFIFEMIRNKNSYKRIYLTEEYSFFENKYFYKEILSSLINKNILTIANISFYNENSSKEIKFDNLSSGQKSIFNLFFSISSAIEDNSLICVDEPEISLHPEWQAEFILKFQEIFYNNYGCHFIIATHSPQIVSGLNSENGFVVDLENNITYSSKEYSKKSADYQLAKIFNAPGYNNEYLIRIGLSLLTKLTQSIDFTAEDYNNLYLLNDAKKELPDNDVVYHLINQINALV